MKKIIELYKYRYLLSSMTLSNLRTRYKGSFLGFLWTLFNPILLISIYSFVFSTIMRFDLENYTIFLFVGILSWFMFQSSLIDSAGIFMSNANMVKKVYFPREILPFSQVTSAVVNYFFSLIVLIVAMLIFGVKITSMILYLPLILLVQVILMLALSLLISILSVFFRDLQHILNVIILAWFYFTPIIFPVTRIPEEYQPYFAINPMNAIIVSFQDIFYWGKAPNINSLAVVGLISFVLLIFSWLVFNSLSKKIAEEI